MRGSRRVRRTASARRPDHPPTAFRYVELLLHTINTRRGRGLLGSIGWLLPRPSRDGSLRFASYRATANDSGGLYVPDLAYDIYVERLLEVASCRQ